VTSLGRALPSAARFEPIGALPGPTYPGGRRGQSKLAAHLRRAVKLTTQETENRIPEVLGHAHASTLNFGVPAKVNSLLRAGSRSAKRRKLTAQECPGRLRRSPKARSGFGFSAARALLA
jgi:hypothetical protein